MKIINVFPANKEHCNYAIRLENNNSVDVRYLTLEEVLSIRSQINDLLLIEDNRNPDVEIYVNEYHRIMCVKTESIDKYFVTYGIDEESRIKYQIQLYKARQK